MFKGEVYIWGGGGAYILGVNLVSYWGGGGGFIRGVYLQNFMVS